MNVDVVGEAYDIAAHYLKKTGQIADSVLINEQLLEVSTSCSTAVPATGCCSPTRRS